MLEKDYPKMYMGHQGMCHDQSTKIHFKNGGQIEQDSMTNDEIKR
jgi:hypothetical protein